LPGRVQRALVDPEMRHHGAGPGADEAAAPRIVAECHQRRRETAAAGHLTPPLGNQPETAERAHGFHPRRFLRRLSWPRRGTFGLEAPFADEPLQPAVLRLRFGHHPHLPPFAWM